ncbi:hypothetical protein M9H77_27362 [Catharanthus roseus]|uniref:Uncharacterized protein n=1 Tax=Catharanthus roseus TaxID=4058 RepID=A0ACC0ACP6_CATRO|nr:hypothetical protein M9H77_27362 [Catharanthus roseus]
MQMSWPHQKASIDWQEITLALLCSRSCLIKAAVVASERTLGWLPFCFTALYLRECLPCEVCERNGVGLSRVSERRLESYSPILLFLISVALALSRLFLSPVTFVWYLIYVPSLILQVKKSYLIWRTT